MDPTKPPVKLTPLEVTPVHAEPAQRHQTAHEKKESPKPSGDGTQKTVKRREVKKVLLTWQPNPLEINPHLELLRREWSNSSSVLNANQSLSFAYRARAAQSDLSWRDLGS